MEGPQPHNILPAVLELPCSIFHPMEQQQRLIQSFRTAAAVVSPPPPPQKVPRQTRGRETSSQRCRKLERLQHLALSHDWQTSPQNRKRRGLRIFLLCLGCKNAEKKNSSWDTTEGEVLDFDHAAENTRMVFHWERCTSLYWAWVLFRSPKKQSSLEEGLHLWAWAQIIHVRILCGCTNTTVGMLGSFKKLSPENMAKSLSLWWETTQANELEKGFSKRSREENMESSTSGSVSFDIQMFSYVMRLSEWLSVQLVDVEVIWRRCRWMLAL